MFALIVQRPVAVAMISLAAALFGALSYQQRPMSLMPPLTFPTLTVMTRYEGAAPEEVEGELTDPIEERLGTVEGLRALRSKSKAGRSEVQLELAWGADLNYSLQRVYERLDRLKLPEGVDPPQVLRYDPTLDPLMVIALTVTPPSNPTDSTLTLTALRRYAEESLAPFLHQVKGVAAVKVTGGDQARVEVLLHPEALSMPHGAVVSLEGEGPVLKCAEGGLRLTRVQRPNRSTVSGADFIRGYPLTLGASLN